MKKYVIFKKPYILIEDLRKRHQPFYKEYDDKAPRLSLTSPLLGCPFLDNKKIRFSKKKGARNGTCEVCYTKYADYREHVDEAEHREFAMDDRNYREVDMFIAELARESSEKGSVEAMKYLTNMVPDIDGFIDNFLNKG